MRNLWLALAFGLLGLASAQAQVVSWPPPGGTVATLCVYNLSPPALSTTNVGFVQCDANGNLRIAGTVTATLAGTTSNASSGVATSATNVPVVAYTYGFNGTTWDQLQVDASKNLKITGTVAATQSGTWTVTGVGGTFPVTGTFFQATQPVSIASGQVASGAISSGAVASGAFASGSIASGAIAAGAHVDLLTMRGPVAAGAAAANSILSGLVYNSTAPVLTTGQQVADQADTAGSHQVNTEGKKATYSTGNVGLVPAAAATDIACLSGSASKTVRVTRIQLAGIATAASAVDIILFKRSTANSGGTSAVFTLVPNDSTSSASTASGLQYTANPSTGAIVGVVRAQKMTLTTVAGAIPIVPVIWDFTTNNSQGMVLRGTAQSLCLNWNGQTTTGNSIDYDWQWTEE